MEEGRSKYRVFDHLTDGKLGRLASSEALKFQPIAPTQYGDQEDESAKDCLIADTQWEIAFVHIDDAPWHALCEAKNVVGRVIVRFSTEGYPPMPRQGASAICLHCVKRIDELTDEDLRALKDALTKKEVLEGFLQDHVPNGIRHLIKLVAPKNLVALHILLQGVLATWAANSGGDSETKHRTDRARELLHLTDTALAAAPSGLDERRTLWKALGLEVSGAVDAELGKTFRTVIAEESGVASLEGIKELQNLVESVLCGDADATPDSEAVFEGFTCLEKMVTR